jgi:excisionase family DNA binding protein
MTLPEFNPLLVPPAEIPAALAALAAWQSQLAARLLRAPASAPAAIATADGDNDKLLTVEETAERLRRSTKWIYRRVKTLPFARHLGRSWVFSEQGLEKWLARQKG